MTSPTLPPITDKARRILRTAVQAALAFISLAALVPLVEPVFGAPHSSNIAEYAVAAGAWITAVSAVLSAVMAIPAVDRVLTVLGVGSLPPSRVAIVLREAAAQVEKVLQVTEPAIEAALPGAEPVIRTVEDIAKALTPEQTDLTSVTASATDPTPATAVIATAAPTAPAV